MFRARLQNIPDLEGSGLPNKVLEGSGVGILVVPVYIPEQLPGKIPQRLGSWFADLGC